MSTNMIDRTYGSWRGLVRLYLANAKRLAGCFRQNGRADLGQVRRLVFVCHGNICRSPFGHFVAEKLIPGVPVVSFGLSTSTGIEAYDMAQDVAKDFSIDLSSHRATDIHDFNIEEGDLILVMEDRHIDKLRPFVQGRGARVALLGLWCHPPLALLYDPHTLSRDYFTSCFSRIQQAVEVLAADIARDAAKD